MKEYYFKTTETKVIETEVIRRIVANSPEEGKTKLLDQVKSKEYQMLNYPWPRHLNGKSTETCVGIEALEKECVNVPREYFMSQDEMDNEDALDTIHQNIVNMKNDHTEIYTEMQNVLDGFEPWDEEYDQTICDYYEKAYDRKIFMCPSSESYHYIEDGVMAEFEGDKQLVHKLEAKLCDRCGQVLVAGDNSECENCSW